MLAPEEDFEQEVESEPRTDTLVHLPRPFDYRNILVERRQQILQQKAVEPNTDALPPLKPEPSGSRLALRQVIQLREENRHLRALLDGAQREKEQFAAAYTAMQTEVENDVEAVRCSYQQEIEQYQAQLQEIAAAYGPLLAQNEELRQRYDDLYYSFKHVAEEEAHQMVLEAAAALERSPNEVPVLLHDVVQSLQVRAQQLEDKHLVEILYLKREMQRLADELFQERQRVDQERQRVIVMQNTVREQSELRRKAMQTHLYGRWRVSLVITATSLLAVYLVLQGIALYLLRASLSPLAIAAMIAPLIICSVLAVILSHPLSMARHIYKSAPHKKPVKRSV